MTGGGATACPLDVTGTLAEIIAAPAIEVFEGQDIRATIGAAVELAAPRGPGAGGLGRLRVSL